MSKIRAFDFANYVDVQKQILASHCRENGKTITGTESLGQLNVINNTINIPSPTPTSQQHEVKFIDIDGTILETQIINHGEAATLPASTPSYDAEYLEFIEWKYDAISLDNIVFDTYCFPQYRVKQDSTINNERPTIFKCLLTTDNVTITLNFSNYSSSYFTNAYVDFGDGGAPEQITSNTKTHTYTSTGIKVIKIYGTKYRLNGSSSNSILSPAAVLVDAYIGENAVWPDSTSYTFYNQYSLKTVIFDPITTSFGGRNNGIIQNCKSIKVLLLPDCISGRLYILGNLASNCPVLEYVYISKEITKLELFNDFLAGSAIKKIVLPYKLNSVTHSNISGNNNLMSSTTYLETLIILTESLELNCNLASNCPRLKNVLFNNLQIGRGNVSYSTNSSFSGSLITFDISLYCSNGISMSGDYNYITEVLTIPYYNNGIPNCPQLKYLSLPTDYNTSFTMPGKMNLLSDSSLLAIAANIKDNTETGTVKTITLSYAYLSKVYSLIINGISWVEYVTAKNWTVSFSNS